MEDFVGSGHLELDFIEGCKRAGITDPPHLLRIPFPLPPLPMRNGSIGVVAPASVGRDSVQPGSVCPVDVTVDGPVDEKTAPQTNSSATQLLGGADVSGVLGQTNDLSGLQATTGGSDEKPATVSLLHSRTPSAQHCKYKSRYRFQPTICVESDEDDEIYKVEVRGWKLSTKVLEVLSAILPICTTVTCLTLWNCHLEEAHFSSILSAVLSSNIRSLAIDQNPLIPQHLFAYLITDESTLKSLSLRMNQIGDAGAKSIASSLKTNRMLTSLNLWDNMIGKEGALDIAEALKYNQTLTALSLGRNNIGDEGAIAIGKVLSNYALLHDEIISRRKALLELEKQRREQEEDPIVKRAKGRINTGHGRNSSANAKLKSEETLVKKDAASDAKSAKKGGPVSATAGAKNAKKGAPEPQAQKRTPESGTGAASANRKGTAPSNTAPAEEKKGSKGVQEKKGATTAAAKAGTKKGKVEETREETEEQSAEIAPAIEPMFERGGQWFVLGNRTLNSLNLSFNGIAEAGFKTFIEVINEQESSADNAPEGMVGLFRLVVQGNPVDKDSTVISHLQGALLARNPYHDKGKKEDDVEEEDEGNSVLEEE